MPVTVDRYVLSPDFGANCYAVRASADAREHVVIDPGGDPSSLLAALERTQGTVAGILITHSDVDHVEGMAALAEATGAEVWAPAGEAQLLRDGFTRTGREVAAHPIEHEVRDGEVVSLGGIDFDVVGVPGHSVDHVAFCAAPAIFSGDLLFESSVGRVDLPGGDWQQLLASITRLLERYGPDAVAYPGHGEPTTLGHELATNPFLRELRAR